MIIILLNLFLIFFSANLFSILNILNEFYIKIFFNLLLFLNFFLIIKKIKNNFFKRIASFIKKEYFSIILILISFTVLFSLSIKVLPNNWDSMTYHLPKIMHWLQDKNLNFYPTHNLRQLYLSPFTEIVQMYFYVIGNNNPYFFNLVQLFSTFLIIPILFSISTTFFKKTNFILITVMLLTLPETILQSTSTQNNIFLALIIALFYYFYIRYIKNKKNLELLFSAIALGLAIYTKGTAYFFLFIPILLFNIKLLFEKNFKEIFKSFILFTLFIFLINGLFFWSNFKLFKTVFPQQKPFIQNNEIYSLKQFISNLSKNIAMQLFNANNYLNKEIYNGVVKLHKFINFDVNDIRTTWFRTKFYIPTEIELHNEDMASNPIHFLLFLISSLYFIFNKKILRKNTVFYIFNLSIFLSFILFSTILKWQPWHTRLIQPLLILSVIPISIFIENINLLNFFKLFLISFLIFNSYKYYFYNASKPILPISNSIFKKDEISQLLANRPFEKEAFMKFNSYLKDIDKNELKKVGIIGGDDYEYPIWYLIKKKNRDVEVYHCFVKNKSAIIAKKECEDIDFFVFTREQKKLLNSSYFLNYKFDDFGYLIIVKRSE